MTPSETAVGRRLREMARQHRLDDMAFSMLDSPDADAIDVAREAIELLREPLTATDWRERRAALLARCEGEK